jgi:hypothetical protein
MWFLVNESQDRQADRNIFFVVHRRMEADISKNKA